MPRSKSHPPPLHQPRHQGDDGTTLETRWKLDELRATLRELAGAGWAAIDVQAVASTDSTNTRLIEAARLDAADAAPSLRLLVADEQTQGRGRLGRAWRSRPGASLTFSMSLPMPHGIPPDLSLAVGVAIVQALEPGDTSHLALKWPNDIWLRDAAAPWGGRKLGGILLETTAAGHTATRTLVIGIGLNLQQPWTDSTQATAASSEAAPPTAYGVASLEELLHAPGGATPTLHAVAPAVLAMVLGAANPDLGSRGGWREAWAARDILRGQTVEAIAGSRLITGVAEGIDGDGALRLRDANGLMHAVHSGEASVRQAQPVAASGAEAHEPAKPPPKPLA